MKKICFIASGLLLLILLNVPVFSGIGINAVWAASEGWESAPMGTTSPADEIPGFFADMGAWLIGDTASDCGATPHTAKILMWDESKALKLTSGYTTGGCADNIWASLSELHIPDIVDQVISIPLTSSTNISFKESGSLTNPQKHGWGGCNFPPCYDNVSLQIADKNGNVVSYVLQRYPLATPETRTNYKEFHLDEGAGTYQRNLFNDFSEIQNFNPNNALINAIEFQVDEHGSAKIDNIKISEDPLPPVLITNSYTFTRRIVDHSCRPDGWYLFFQVYVNDSIGAPDNIASVTAVNTDTGIDSTVYSLNKYSSGYYYGFVPYAGQRGTYRFTVTNNQGQTAQASAAPIDVPRMLDEITGVSVSNTGTTPTVSFNSVANADKYRLKVYTFDPGDGCPDGIYSSAKTDAPVFAIPAGVMSSGSSYIFRLEARDYNNEDSDLVNDQENKSEKYIAFTPGQNITITGVRSFTETIANHPWGRSDGGYVHLKMGVYDHLGVPDNIASATAVNLDTGIDPETYDLELSIMGSDAYFKHPAYNGQSGTYKFTVTNKQGETETAAAYPIDDSVQLDVIQNLQISDEGTTPGVSFDPVTRAERYRITVFDSTPKTVYQSSKSDNTSFRVPAGVMTVGSTYHIRAEAYDDNPDDGDGINDLENRSVRFIESAPSCNSYDTDCDCSIGDFELLDAIDDWAKGNLDDFGLLDLIDYWAKGSYCDVI